MKSREFNAPALRTVFGVVAAVLVASLVVTYWVGNQAIRHAKERTALEEISLQVQQAFSALQDAETGQRGYLLTNRRDYLEPYEAALDQVPSRLRRLQHAVEMGRLPADAARRFGQVAQEKLDELARTLEVAEQRGVPAAVEIVNDGSGKRTMDRLRAVFAELQAWERTQISALERSSAETNALRTWTFIVMGLVNLAFLLWAHARIRRESAQRYVADLEAQRERDVLAVSLASIGDAVIIADTEAQITFLNDVAVELTGWSRASAIGRPCAKVFRIINETSRVPVDSPVDLVLKTGKIVGLANHTLLLRKDGSEVPIDDSGAPIREPDGSLRGVILVFRDFTKYKRAEEEQLRLKERLEVANKAKDDFIAALSHELRTPLTPVLATLSTWETGRDLPPALAEDVRMLIRNVRLEVRLIDDLLDLTRIARGQMTLYQEPVDAHELLAAVVEIFRADLERRQVRLGVRAAAERHFVQGDPARLQQVFWNILGNAVKFTPDGGRIEIVTANEADAFRVTFADNGRGMSAETIKNLFHPFERTTGPRSYLAGGLGIGLTISENLVHAHGGRIEARSSGPGLGSSFVVRIPALPQAAGPAEKSPAAGKTEVKMAVLAILLVEDHADSADVIARLLRRMGHTVEVAGDVGHGLAALRRGGFDLVLTDIGLPDGTGIELLAAARAFNEVPMVALTGYGMEDDLTKYRDAGFLRQLTKPVRYEQLEDLLRSFGQSRGRPGGLTVRPQPTAEDLPGGD